MQIDKISQKKLFFDEGYFVCKKLVDENFIKKILDEIGNSKDTVKYFDNENNLRRIEKLFDKGVSLKDLNDKILIILKNIFEEEFVIFKDKFNAKPPGGEGFFAHFDGVFNFNNVNGMQKNGWYEYGNFLLMSLLH